MNTVLRFHGEAKRNARDSSFVKRFVLSLIMFTLVTSMVFRSPAAKAEESRACPQTSESDPNIVLLNAVWEKVLAVAGHPAGFSRPPRLHLLTDAEMTARKMRVDAPNAFATLHKGAPVVCINKAMLGSIVEGNASRLALILGHELSHITLGHVLRARGQTQLLATVYSREQELAADRNGIRVALAAGYDFSQAMGAPKRFIDLDLEVPPMWPSNHPSWSQRLARLEKNRTSLWKSAGVFNNGVLFLTVEQYASAERCFAEVVRQFPDACEAHANLGYARLMQYCDLLRPEDVAGFGIAHILAGGFYRRPDSLIEKGRGINAGLWRQAVDSLEEALRLKPGLALAKASLGIAYLVRPEGKDVERASRYLEAAAVKDESLGAFLRATVLVNLSVADLTSGKADSCDRHLREAYRLADRVDSVRAAILYNYAQELLQSGKENSRREAADALYKYLKLADTASIWWKLGWESYVKLCAESGVKCETEEQLRASARQGFRPLPPVEAGSGIQIQIGDSIEEVQKRLGAAVSIPIARDANLNRYRYPKLGIDVIGTDQVIAVSLNGRVAPALKLQSQGVGGQTKTLRAGMTADEVARALGAKSSTATVFSAATPYRFYPQVGLAARFVGGRVAEWLVVILPRGE